MSSKEDVDVVTNKKRRRDVCVRSSLDDDDDEEEGGTLDDIDVDACDKNSDTKGSKTIDDDDDTINVTMEDVVRTQTHMEQLNRELAHFTLSDGHVGQCVHQMVQLMRLVKGKKRILEIGFHAGHSAMTFLSNTDIDATVTSIDIGFHVDYLPTAKIFIDRMFPGRHTLVLGDSREILCKWSVARQAAEVAGAFSTTTATTTTMTTHPSMPLTTLLFCKPYDFIFIDGSHDYPTVLSDFHHCFHELLDKTGMTCYSSSSVLVLNDVSPSPYPQAHHTFGPTRVWHTEVEEKIGPFAKASQGNNGMEGFRCGGEKPKYELHFQHFYPTRGMGWIKLKHPKKK